MWPQHHIRAINANRNRLTICCSSKGLTPQGWPYCRASHITACPREDIKWNNDCSKSTGHFPTLARGTGIGAVWSAKAAGAQWIPAPSMYPSEVPWRNREAPYDPAQPSVLNSAFKAQSLLQLSKIWRFREVSNSPWPFLGHYHTTPCILSWRNPMRMNLGNYLATLEEFNIDPLNSKWRLCLQEQWRCKLFTTDPPQKKKSFLHGCSERIAWRKTDPAGIYL